RKFTFKPGSIPQIIDHQRGRLHIRNQIGMGNFANVFSVSFTPRDSTDQRNVAMKINQFEHKSEENQYLKSSIEREAQALRKISDYVADSGKESFIAECLFSDDLGPNFHFMIMPMYSTDLKDLIIRNKLLFADILNIKTLARQLFQALDVLSSMNPPVIHCDVTPANIMVESISPLKIRLSDFGCCEEGNKQNQESDYIVTRWYRPPEIVLGCPYGPPVDMWGVGCTLFETHSRNYLFAGDFNKHMFYLHAGLIGPIPISFFESIPVQIRTKLPVVLIDNQYHFTFDEKKLNHLLLSKQKFDHFFPKNSSGSSSSEDDSSGSDFREFLKNIFTWSPEERLTPSQALMHPFLAIP
ncbi:MAG: serine/threonine-protein kinase, partial [Chlamydiae bacterium]|nr:serine/threonine-protein kinase [Chlamydiota bacterium]